MSKTETIMVEVAFALPEKQKIIEVFVEEGTTAYQAVQQSNISSMFSEINIAEAKMGVFGQVLGTKGMADVKDYKVKAGDRIEIYRPLIADPKEVRRKRAEKTKEEKNNTKLIKGDAAS